MAKKKKTEPTAPALNWLELRLEAIRAYGPGMFGMLALQEERLHAAGKVGCIYPPMSPWWLRSLRDFYASGKTFYVACAGRGSGKSETLTRAAVVEALFGERKIPSGQRWVFPFVSASKGDARRRIDSVRELLADAWGIYTEVTFPEGVASILTEDAQGQPIVFVSYAGTVASLSGFNAIGFLVDEEAKLRDKTGNANPSTELLRSLRATFRARPGVRGFRCSSAYDSVGSFWQQVTAGDDAMHFVASIGEESIKSVRETYAHLARYEPTPQGAALIRDTTARLTPASPNVPTWVCNPTITADMARRLEPDVSAFLREICGFPITATQAGKVDQITGLLEFNRALCAIGQQDTGFGLGGGLIQFEGLPSWDPRSTNYRGRGGGGNGRGVF